MFQGGVTRLAGLGFVIHQIRTKFTLALQHYNLLKATIEGHITGVLSKVVSECRRPLIVKTRGLPAFFLLYVLSDHSIIVRKCTRDGRVVRWHVKKGYFLMPPKQVTSPTWVPPCTSMSKGP